MAVVEIHRHRFTVEDFAHMGEAGIFAADDRVELIDGEIREMTPIGPPMRRPWIGLPRCSSVALLARRT